jgi:hypothetical protein
MRHILAAVATIAVVTIAAPPTYAAPIDIAVQSLSDQEIAYVKRGGKGGKHGLKRRGPPSWAPAYGRRYKRR